LPPACEILTIVDVYAIILDMDTTIAGRTTPQPTTHRHAEEDAQCCDGTRVVAPPTLNAERTALLAERLKALADPTRLRMLDLLAKQPEPLCVCHITEHFAQHQPTISHHLRILRQAGLISGEKRGVWSYYWATEAGRESLSVVRTLL
jgi:ArsR family transcriptional regulator, arsenate/arsenite/antimonite-responsive transcriptional repressor